MMLTTEFSQNGPMCALEISVGGPDEVLIISKLESDAVFSDIEESNPGSCCNNLSHNRQIDDQLTITAA